MCRLSICKEVKLLVYIPVVASDSHEIVIALGALGKTVPIV
jgi:hypothetical protein